MAKGELDIHPNVCASAQCALLFNTVSVVPAIAISHKFRDYNVKLNFIKIRNILIKNKSMNLI